MLPQTLLPIAMAMFCSLALFAEDKSSPPTQENYPPKMADAKVEAYKIVDGVKLNVYIFNPKKHEGNESRPAIVFFFGGGWKAGTPEQFQEHCRHLAARGMVAMTADYRVRTRHETTADVCVADAKSAIRWVRTNARRLGVDPDRIVAGGGSAGGHIAACTAVIDGFESTDEDSTVSSKPNGLALFNPALVLAPAAGIVELTQEKQAELRDRLGGDPKRLSPFHQLQGKLPPTIIFHGKADTTVAYKTAEAFAKSAKQFGTAVELNGYDDAGHGFFNFGREQSQHYRQTMLRMDQFLVDHGLLEGPSPQEIEVP